MVSLNELASRRNQAKATLELALARLQPLTDQMQATGTAPPGWQEQNNVVKAAQASFDNANDAYLNAVRQTAENRK